VSWFIGRTGVSFLDVWTVPHLGFWVFIGSTLWALRVSQVVAVLACVGVAFAWEVFERVAEKAWPKLWLSPESWWNAWLSDPLTAVIGVLGMYLMLNRWGGRS
jgi:hypothetical protein